MKFLITISAFIICLFFNVNAVPNLPCFYEKTILSTETLTESQTDATACKEVYVYTNDPGMSITLKFTNVNIDCTTGNSDLRIIDHNGQIYTYCDSNPGAAFEYSSTGSSYVAVQEMGVGSFTMGNTFISTNDLTCGKPAIEPNTNSRIVGGEDARPNSWPWQTYISDGNYICAASLLNNNWLVTAAHCSMNINNFYARLGDHNIYQTGDGETLIKIESFTPHPNYASNNAYDVAVMKLATPANTTSDKIKTICLPGDRVTADGENAFVTGWGLTSEGGNISPTLKQVSVKIQASSVCGSNPTTDICAGTLSPVHDSCQGDSGGPLVIKDNTTNSWYLAGIVSRGYGCRGGGVYTRVSHVQQWILDTIAAK